MNADGDVIGAPQGRSVDAFEDGGKKAQKFLELKKKADAGDKKALAEVIVTELMDGRIKISEADKKLKGVDLSADQKKQIESIRPDAEVREIMQDVNPQDEAGALVMGKKFAERLKAGKANPNTPQMLQNYLGWIMKYAESEKDADLYEKGLTPFEAKFGSSQDPKAKAFFANAHKTLEKLKQK